MVKYRVPPRLVALFLVLKIVMDIVRLQSILMELLVIKLV